MIYLLQHALDEAAELAPDQDAFRCLNESITFANLSVRSNQLAHALCDQGVQPGDRVGIYMTRSLKSAVGVYGVFKAGAAYVPMDPRLPLNSLQKIITDCGIRILIVDQPNSPTLRHLLSDNHHLEAIIGGAGELPAPLRAVAWDQLDQFQAQRAPVRFTTEQDLAYLMYTSGSTGRPKGIMHTHHSGLSYAGLAVQTYDVQSDDRIGNHSPLHFDMSTFGYFSAPLARATTILIPEAYTKIPASLSQLMESERLTIWYSVPLALIQLRLRGVLEQRDLSCLRWVLFGGEPFPPKHLHALRHQWPDTRFSNVYGPAEVNQCTYFHLPPAGCETPRDERDDEPVPIGKVWANTEGRVLNEDDEPVNPGGTGELVIRSPTMMQGYWARPDLNSVAFYRETVYSSFRKVFYRTGDLVQLQEDGNYVFLGRKDRQVKIRGHRVELDEIEFSLTSHPQVDEAAAFAVQRSEEAVQVEAAVILRPDAAMKSDELIAYVAERLPWYAVPQKVAMVSSFPRTSSGKIDRRQLQNRAVE